MLENCPHRFCYDCIHYYATNVKNKCPLCLKKFNKITFWALSDTGLVQKTEEIKDLNIYDTEEAD